MDTKIDICKELMTPFLRELELRVPGLEVMDLQIATHGLSAIVDLEGPSGENWVLEGFLNQDAPSFGVTHLTPDTLPFERHDVVSKDQEQVLVLLTEGLLGSSSKSEFLVGTDASSSRLHVLKEPMESFTSDPTLPENMPPSS